MPANKLRIDVAEGDKRETSGTSAAASVRVERDYTFNHWQGQHARLRRLERPDMSPQKSDDCGSCLHDGSC